MSLDMLTTLNEKRKDSESLMRCIRETTDNLFRFETSLENPGVIFGHIQSGKTRAFIGVVADCFDRDYDIAIILTKGTRALAIQTYLRIRSDFSEYIDSDEVRLFDILHLPTNLSAYERRKKIVIVVKKERNNLERVIRAIEETYPDLATKRILIIDDEADYASVTYRQNRSTGTVEQGTIARLIDVLRRGAAGSAFLQVTATPYSLYLQPNDNAPTFTFLPRRPAFTSVLEPHDSYIGGDYYFNLSQDPDSLSYYFFEEIHENEILVLRRRDGRRLNLADVLTSRSIQVFRSALINFIVGALIRRWQQEREGSRIQNYGSFEFHVGQAMCGLSLLKSSFPAMRKITVRMVDSFL